MSKRATHAHAPQGTTEHHSEHRTAHAPHSAPSEGGAVANWEGRGQLFHSATRPPTVKRVNLSGFAGMGVLFILPSFPSLGNLILFFPVFTKLRKLTPITQAHTS